MNWIVRLGQSMQFVAFSAHLFSAAYLVNRWERHWWMAAIVTAIAAVKEFWFDARYETDPPQTFTDNLEDFLGWTLGAWLGLL